MKRILIALLMLLSFSVHGEEKKLEYTEIPEDVLNSINAYSARTLVMMEQGGAENFDYSEDSVKFLSSVIDEEGPTYSEKAKSMLPSVWGSYLGDALIKKYSGKWVQFGNSYGVLIGESKLLFPMAKVEKHIENGSADSIYALYLVAGSDVGDIETQTQ